jgi:hypothetical protein
VGSPHFLALNGDSWVDQALGELSPLFSRLYARIGRPSIPPEQLLRALVLQILYSIRSERLLMERLDADAARQAARDYLRIAGFDGHVSVSADTLRVTVDLVQDRPTVMMGLLGIRTVRTEAHAAARPRAGIEGPEA